MTEEEQGVGAPEGGASGQDPAARWPAWAWLLPILLWAEFLRLPYLLHPWLKDQAAIHAIVSDLVTGRAHSAFPMPYTTTTFHRMLGGLFAVFGEEVLLPRVLAAALAAATTVATFALARRFFGTTAAVMAAVLTATSPLLLSTPAVGLPNDPLVLLVTLLLLHSGCKRDDARFVVAGAAVLGLAMYVRFFYAPAAPLWGLLVLVGARRGRRVQLGGAFAITLGLVTLPLAWILFGTETGLNVVAFVRDAVTGSSTMHTTIGTAQDTPLAQRFAESVVTTQQIVLGRMNVGGMMHAAGINWPGMVLTAAGSALAILRLLRPRPSRALEDRLLGVWMLGAAAILVLVVAWPSEIQDPDLGPYRAPRYFILLFPAPWIAAGGALQWVVDRIPARSRPRATGMLLLGLGLLASLPAAPGGALATLLGRVGRVVDEAASAADQVVELIHEETGEIPLIIADVPPGTAERWRAPRFFLSYDTFLAELSDGAELQRWRADSRLGLAIDFSQMLYQVQPDLYAMELRLGGLRVPARIHLLNMPFPPLGPVRAQSQGRGPKRQALVMISSSPGAPVLRQRIPGVHEDRLIDRIKRFETLQPELTRLLTVIGAVQPAYAFFRLELDERVWSNLHLRFGRAGDAVRAPDRVWAFAETVFVPELGYGFTHGFLEPGNWRNAQQGLLPRYPVRFVVRTPDEGLYEGELVALRGCESGGGSVAQGGQVLRGEHDRRCEGDSNVRWLPEVYRFCAKPQDGLVVLDLAPQPQDSAEWLGWSAPWLLQELKLRRADGTPRELRLGGCEAELGEAAPAAGGAQALEDPAGDAGAAPWHDLLGARALDDGIGLRIRLAELPAPGRSTVVEFLVGQGSVLLGVHGDLRSGRCTVGPLGSPEAEDVEACLIRQPGAVDVRLPPATLARWLDPGGPLDARGIATCCSVGEQAWDQIDGSIAIGP